MAGREIRVNIVADFSAIKAAMGRAILATAGFRAALHQVRRVTVRILDTPGDRHIDRVCREIATGVPGRDPVIRLIAASDFAAILDRSYTA